MQWFESVYIMWKGPSSPVVRNESNAECNACGTIRTTTVSGQTIRLTMKTSHDRLYQEFIISNSPLPIRLWIFMGLPLSILTFSLSQHLEDTSLCVLIIAVLLMSFLTSICLHVKTEWLVVMSGVCVQVRREMTCGLSTTNFYDVSLITGVVINEAITMHSVVHYLALLVRQDDSTDSDLMYCSSITSLVPIFTHCCPSLSCLERIRSEVLKSLNIWRSIEQLSWASLCPDCHYQSAALSNSSITESYTYLSKSFEFFYLFKLLILREQILYAQRTFCSCVRRSIVAGVVGEWKLWTLVNKHNSQTIR